jgi:ABC-2 type transport system permease protein
MFQDIMTIVWKEFRELFLQRDRFRGGLVGMIIFLVCFGILMPLQTGSDWVRTPVSLLYWVWIPFLMVMGVVADSFAGERERHTLETLLASRLSDRAILFGKLSAAIGYAWGLTLASMLLSLITVNIAHGKGQLLMYPAIVGIGIIVLSFLIATVAAGLGVWVSLRASTVRQAQQTLGLMYFGLFIPLFILPMLPNDIKVRVFELFMSIDSLDTLARIMLTAAGILALIAAMLIGAAMTRFKRARLILD